MTERHNTVTFKGQPVTLEGGPAEVGQPAPDFTVLKNDLTPLERDDLRGRVTILTLDSIRDKVQALRELGTD